MNLVKIRLLDLNRTQGRAYGEAAVPPDLAVKSSRAPTGPQALGGILSGAGTGPAPPRGRRATRPLRPAGSAPQISRGWFARRAPRRKTSQGSAHPGRPDRPGRLDLRRASQFPCLPATRRSRDRPGARIARSPMALGSTIPASLPPSGRRRPHVRSGPASD